MNYAKPMNAHPSTLYLVRAQHSRGLTMVELMVTLSILAILTVLATPSFTRMIASTRVSSATNELFASLSFAKSEAIKRGSRMTICPSTDGTSCTTGTNLDWAVGWIVFNDTTRATLPIVDSGEAILQVGQNVSDQLIIRGNSGTDYASFGPDGAAKYINGSFLNGTVRVCSTSASLSNNNRARDISIRRSGRIEISTPTAIAATCPAP